MPSNIESVFLRICAINSFQKSKKASIQFVTKMGYSPVLCTRRKILAYQQNRSYIINIKQGKYGFKRAAPIFMTLEHLAHIMKAASEIKKRNFESI